jgi:tetratricopeptide (TPR) repeat protein
MWNNFSKEYPMKKLFILLVLNVGILSASPAAKIASVTGDVKVRRGLEENWQAAAAGMLLESIDTILCLEGKAVLEIQDGQAFQLGSHAILDIGDLRTITRQELFLFLVSEKVKAIEPRGNKTELKVGNVSVVHGEFKGTEPSGRDASPEQARTLEFNGAQALYRHSLFSNAIIKLYKIIEKYPRVTDCGEAYYYIGQSFSALNEKGQAVDAYDKCLAEGQSCEGQKSSWMIDAAEMAKKLRRE